MGTDLAIATVVMDSGHPKSGHVSTGIVYARVAALPIVHAAVRLQSTLTHPNIDQRALAAVLSGASRIPTVEGAPSSDLPVHRLDHGWCRFHNSHLRPSDHAYLWHASVRSPLRLPCLRTWIDQGRHTHPAGEPLPAAWCIPTLLTKP